MSIEDQLNQCNGQIVFLTTIYDMEYTGLLEYDPSRGRFSVVIRESCGEITIMSPDDVNTVDCS